MHKDSGVEHSAIASQHELTFLGLVLLAYSSIWVARIWCRAVPGSVEAAAFSVYVLCQYGSIIRDYLRSAPLLNDYSHVIASFAICVLVGYIYFLFDSISLLNPREGRGQRTSSTVVDHASHDSNDIFLSDHVFPCQTTHTRLFPKKHSFTYSYLLVGIALPAFAGNDDNTGAEKDAKPWLTVKPQDHLERDGAGRSMRAKLESYLRAEGEEPSNYPFAYLVTAPTFLGYCFNPVSFWYLYNKNQDLRYMILEVNNTFDERRMYLLRRDVDPPKGQADDVEQPWSKTFTNSWSKDFHVSPFNSRKGAYSLKAEDIIDSARKGGPQVSNVITLQSSKEHAKLVASIRSTAPGIDARRLSKMQKVRFLLAWWWVGFVTYPRIVKEAAKLFFKRKLHVWYRPEVLSTSIGRRANASEKDVEPLFCDWLQGEVEASSLEQPLKYDPVTLGLEIKPQFVSRTTFVDSLAQQAILFKPTTPLFYSGMATTQDTDRFLNSCLQCTDPLKLALHTNQPLAIQRAFFAKGDKSPQDLQKGKAASPLDIFRWWLIYVLRNNHWNRLDRFAMGRKSRNTDIYRRSTLKLLVANRLAFGLVEIVDLVVFLVNAWAISVSFGAMLRFVWALWSASNGTANTNMVVRLFSVHLLWVLGKII